MTRTGATCAVEPMVMPVISAFLDSAGHELATDGVVPDETQHGFLPLLCVEPCSV